MLKKPYCAKKVEISFPLANPAPIIAPVTAKIKVKTKFFFTQKLYKIKNLIAKKLYVK